MVSLCEGAKTRVRVGFELSEEFESWCASGIHVVAVGFCDRG